MKNKVLLKWAHLTFWATYLVIYVWFFSHFMSIGMSLLRGMTNGLPLLLIVYVNIWSINYFFEKKAYFTSFIVAIILFIVMIPIRLLINSYFPETNLVSSLASNIDSNIIGVIITNLLFIILSSFYQILVNRLRKEQVHVKELQIHQEAQLNYLKAQINPHFLFNTLNNIYSLAVRKSDDTAGMVIQLSHLLRYVVYESQEKLVNLDKEIDHINKYLDLFRMRSMPKPNIQFEISGQTNQVMIEPMILIPIVENCCKHCDFDINDDAFTSINLEIEGDQLIFTTQNTFNDNAIKDKVGGVGLENIKQRLKILYLNKHHFSTNIDNHIFDLKLTIKIK